MQRPLKRLGTNLPRCEPAVKRLAYWPFGLPPKGGTQRCSPVKGYSSPGIQFENPKLMRKLIPFSCCSYSVSTPFPDSQKSRTTYVLRAASKVPSTGAEGLTYVTSAERLPGPD
jgi:hypothetical protein